ncbi:MAG TPA: response regulator [Thiobacillus sp.]|nr:response regulator [Thiobacillus sp.]
MEDYEVDTITVRRALKGLHGGNPLVRLENGKEAPGYLRQSGRVMPCLILRDLDMTAVMLTTSEELQDGLASFDPGATGYVGKPVDYPQFAEATRATDPCRTSSELPQ